MVLIMGPERNRSVCWRLQLEFGLLQVCYWEKYLRLGMGNDGVLARGVCLMICHWIQSTNVSSRSLVQCNRGSTNARLSQSGRPSESRCRPQLDLI